VSVPCEHAFSTTISASRFEAVVAKTCKAQYGIEVIAHDPTLIPQVRVFNVSFAALEDRDRVRVAMRFLEQEQAERAKAATQAPAPTLARRLVSA
jgi:hypothetical protein